MFARHHQTFLRVNRWPRLAIDPQWAACRSVANREGGVMKFRVLAGLALASLVAIEPKLAAQGSAGEHWVGTWATAAVAVPPQPQAQASPLVPPAPTLNNQTLRQIVHTSIGGDRVRVVLTNTFGTRPLAIGGAHIGLR